MGQFWLCGSWNWKIDFLIVNPFERLGRKPVAVLTAKWFRFLGKCTRSRRLSSSSLERRLGVLNSVWVGRWPSFPPVSSTGVCMYSFVLVLYFSVKQQVIIVHGSNFHFLAFPDLIFYIGSQRPPPPRPMQRLFSIAWSWGTMFLFCDITNIFLSFGEGKGPHSVFSQGGVVSQSPLFITFLAFWISPESHRDN